jgi:hypothetical protein
MGEADSAPMGGRAQLVLDVSGGERSSESGMQHLSLLYYATTIHIFLKGRLPPFRTM